jgi:hypothetical protein
LVAAMSVAGWAFDFDWIGLAACVVAFAVAACAAQFPLSNAGRYSQLFFSSSDTCELPSIFLSSSRASL